MSHDTRQLILDTALGLFEEHGYAATTMRAIATEAGVAPSNAYYWFASKDDLVQEFYRRIQTQHRERAGHALAGAGSLAERLRAAEHASLDVMDPYHGFGRAFLTTAIDPASASSPFSAESREARELSLSIYREVVAGAAPAVPKRMAAVLPDLLWVCHLGVTLFWVTDSSSGQQRTRELVDRSVALLAGTVKLARLPGATGVLDQLAGVLGVVVPRGGPQDGAEEGAVDGAEEGAGDVRPDRRGAR